MGKVELRFSFYLIRSVTGLQSFNVVVPASTRFAAGSVFRVLASAFGPIWGVHVEGGTAG